MHDCGTYARGGCIVSRATIDDATGKLLADAMCCVPGIGVKPHPKVEGLFVMVAIETEAN